jgi:hypothetical protein
MNVGGKINIAIRKTMGYEVALQADGSAETTLVLDYSNTAPFDLPASQNSVFSNYLRVYRAEGAVIAPDSRSARGSTVTVDLGLPTAVREFELARGHKQRETIVSMVRGAWRSGSATVSRYRLFLVRQADLQDVPTTVTVTPPEGWRVASVSAWKVASGGAVAATAEDGRARLEVPLTGDLVLDVGLQRR